MSCTNPQCAIVPFKGGSPIFLRTSYEARSQFIHPVHGLCKVVYLPCGNCMECRIQRRQELTLLQCCEASLYEENWFLTLTYDDMTTYRLTDTLPYSLNKEHLADFNESMRKYCKYNGCQYRYFACGEYGDRYERPHYHLSIFGLPANLLGIEDDFDAQTERKKGIENGILSRVQTAQRDEEGNFFWQSPIIGSRWQYGSHKIYRANRDTYQYVAGYVTKKLTGSHRENWLSSGRICPFSTQSRPSIGRPWFERFYPKMSIPHGSKVVNDTLSIADKDGKIPRIFEKWLLQVDPFEGKEILKRIKKIREHNQPVIPDYEDLRRKKIFGEYRACQFKQNNKHREVN